LNTPPVKANQKNLKLGLLVELQKLEKDAPAKHVLSDVEGHAKFHQIPLFPTLSKGDERGISGSLCVLGVLAGETFLKSFS
jgi:hypothetical protein